MLCMLERIDLNNPTLPQAVTESGEVKAALIVAG